MTMLARMFGRSERRGAAENPLVPLSSPRALQDLFDVEISTVPGVVVDEKTALSVPAVWSAVNFLAGTVASLPMHVYRRDESRRERVTDGMLPIMVHDAINDETTSFRWRQLLMRNVLLSGRSFWRVSRNVDQQPVELWPLERQRMTVAEGPDRRRRYRYELPGGGVKVHQPRNVIDIDMLPAEDGLSHHSPIRTLERTIALAVAVEKYGATLFSNDGVPPLVLSGPFTSPAGVQRASDEVMAAVKQAARDGRKVLVLPLGHELKPIGFDPEKGQMTDVKRFIVEEVARIYQLPPTFLQDLTHGTFSNTEQQDLHFVKHTLRRWLTHIEQECNLKFFGRANREVYVEFNIDGLLRGDFMTRMQGYATGISHGMLKPNEAREQENRAPVDGGDQLLIQGATIPLAQAGAVQSNGGFGGKES